MATSTKILRAQDPRVMPPDPVSAEQILTPEDLAEYSELRRRAMQPMLDLGAPEQPQRAVRGGDAYERAVRQRAELPPAPTMTQSELAQRAARYGEAPRGNVLPFQQGDPRATTEAPAPVRPDVTERSRFAPETRPGVGTSDLLGEGTNLPGVREVPEARAGMGRPPTPPPEPKLETRDSLLRRGAQRATEGARRAAQGTASGLRSAATRIRGAETPEQEIKQRNDDARKTYEAEQKQAEAAQKKRGRVRSAVGRNASGGMKLGAGIVLDWVARGNVDPMVLNSSDSAEEFADRYTEYSPPRAFGLDRELTQARLGSSTAPQLTRLRTQEQERIEGAKAQNRDLYNQYQIYRENPQLRASDYFTDTEKGLFSKAALLAQAESLRGLTGAALRNAWDVLVEDATAMGEGAAEFVHGLGRDQGFFEAMQLEGVDQGITPRGALARLGLAEPAPEQAQQQGAGEATPAPAPAPAVQEGAADRELEAQRGMLTGAFSPYGIEPTTEQARAALQTSPGLRRDLMSEFEFQTAPTQGLEEAIAEETAGSEFGNLQRMAESVGYNPEFAPDGGLRRFRPGDYEGVYTATDEFGEPVFVGRSARLRDQATNAAERRAALREQYNILKYADQLAGRETTETMDSFLARQGATPEWGDYSLDQRNRIQTMQQRELSMRQTMANMERAAREEGREISNQQRQNYSTASDNAHRLFGDDEQGFQDFMVRHGALFTESPSAVPQAFMLDRALSDMNDRDTWGTWWRNLFNSDIPKSITTGDGATKIRQLLPLLDEQTDEVRINGRVIARAALTDRDLMRLRFLQQTFRLTPLMKSS